MQGGVLAGVEMRMTVNETQCSAHLGVELGEICFLCQPCVQKHHAIGRHQKSWGRAVMALSDEFYQQGPNIQKDVVFGPLRKVITQ